MSKKGKEQFKIDFLVIGLRKCATTWLYELFLDSPQVDVSGKVKQSAFFTRYFERGISWYQGLFDQTVSENIRGEIDPDIITCPEASARIQSLYPEVKIIVIFRNPADLFFSSYDHAIRKGDIKDQPVPAWERYPAFRQELEYAKLLMPYYSLFPRDQILVLFYEEIVTQPERILGKINKFLGVEAEYDNQKVFARVNPSRRAKNIFISKLLSRGARVGRRFDLHGLVEYFKRLRYFSDIYEHRDREEIEQERSGDLRKRILLDLQNEIKAFQAMVGVNIEQYWPEIGQLKE